MVPYGMQYTTVLFDFDGTLADTFSIVVDIGQYLVGKYRNQKITHSEIAYLRKKTPLEVIRYFKIPWYMLPFIIREGQKQFVQQLPGVKTVPGMKEVLRSIQREGFTIGIVSSNSQKNVQLFCKNNDIDSINFIEAKPTLFGKTGVIRRALKHQNLLPNQCIYVGDEVRDIEACTKLGITCISVAWGFNDAEILEQKNANRVVYVPKELLNKIKPLKSE
ncbi:HAD-IA family hydrolase [Candidatus Roizmanbacteria bacterium]|nr:HAD-IA family hydrolase [Candidatus Roizmanbacteria bacterium]